MPIYEYSCPKCGRFEAVQKVSERPLRCKPDCAEPDCPKKAKREISAAAFHLKGSGWYKTDYKGSSTGSTGATPSGEKVKKGEANTESSDSNSSTKEGKSTPPKGSGGCGSGCGCH